MKGQIQKKQINGILKTDIVLDFNNWKRKSFQSSFCNTFQSNSFLTIIGQRTFASEKSSNKQEPTKPVWMLEKGLEPIVIFGRLDKEFLLYIIVLAIASELFADSLYFIATHYPLYLSSVNLVEDDLGLNLLIGPNIRKTEDWARPTKFKLWGEYKYIQLSFFIESETTEGEVCVLLIKEPEEIWKIQDVLVFPEGSDEPYELDVSQRKIAYPEFFPDGKEKSRND